MTNPDAETSTDAAKHQVAALSSMYRESTLHVPASLFAFFASLLHLPSYILHGFAERTAAPQKTRPPITCQTPQTLPVPNTTGGGKVVMGHVAARGAHHAPSPQPAPSGRSQTWGPEQCLPFRR